MNARQKAMFDALRAKLPAAPASLANSAGCRLGRVSMDLVTVDVTGLPDDAARPGAAVELLGASVPLDAVAEAAGTIPHDVLTGLGRRPVRRYVR
jgi:alanine racemase